MIDTEKMSAKQWLSRGWKLNEEINTLLEEKERAFADACSTTAASSGERVQSSSGNSSERKFIHYADYSKLIDERIDQLYAIKQEISDAIYKVESSTYRTLLVKRYIQFKTWETIADEMNYDVRWIHRLHGRALNKVGEIRK